MILMDTGPLVALFDPRDKDHKACHESLSSLTEPLHLTEAILTETFHILEPGTKGARGVKAFVEKGCVAVTPLDKAMISRCFELMDKYADLPMDFADATLLVVAEKYRTDSVFTLDFNDFRTYKVKKGHRYYPLNLIGRDLLEG